MANFKQGIVALYDSNTQTAIVNDRWGNTYENVGVPFKRYDLAQGAFSCTPPTSGATCLFGQSDVGDWYIIAIVNGPINIDGDSSPDSNPLNIPLNRTARNSTIGNTKAGNSIDTTSMQAEFVKSDSLYKIKMTPIFYSCWHLVNMLWENMCNAFSFISAGFDLIVNVDGAYNTDTVITARRTTGEKNGVPCLELDIGKTADIVKIKVNGEDFLHLDADKNVTIVAKDIKLTADNVDLSACKAVKLP